MNKRFRNLLSIGAITILTSSSMIPVHAMSKNTYSTSKICSNKITCSTNKEHSNKQNCSTNKKLYLYINGHKFELPLRPSCSIKPNCPSTKPVIKPGCIIIKPVVKPEVKPDDITPSTPVVKPDETPVIKPNEDVQKPSETVKPSTPVEKPNTDTEAQKPVTKPEDNNNTNDNTDNNTNNGVTTPSEQFSEYQREVLNLVNKERTSRGLQPLTLNAKLSNVATIKSQDMINKHYFDHQSPTYGSPFDMMSQFGISYRTAGENIAMGQRSPQEVMNSWMNSSGHRANILNANFKELGVGIAKDANGRLYWTQQFIG